MTFYTVGRTKHELMSIENLFNKRLVEQTSKVDSTHSVIKKDMNLSATTKTQLVKHSYQQIEHFPDEKKLVFAEQIMSSPVITLLEDSSIDQAFKLFHEHKFRHVPVTNSNQQLLGIISDRDILRVLGSSAEYSKTKNVGDVMIPEVLTASRKTDVRYITLLFIENRIGSMPVMDERKLVGIITRSDILKAVLNHYEIELWV